MQRIGPYEILGELGRGGMGVVHRARHTELGREVALKVIGLGPGSSSAAGGDPESTDAGRALVERFEREAAAAGRLSGHPNIVAVHDLGRDGDRLYLAMDLVDGQPLDRLIEEGELTVEQSVRIVAQIADALAHAHAAGVLHRDVKPSNILVEATGAARLADFGLAQSRGADPDVTRLTKSGELLGTPAYMPPEQARGEGVDARADIYSLGAALYDCLTGTPPFAGDSTYRVIAGVLREPPRPPRSRRPGLPRDLDTITLHCLEKAPGDRYQRAADLAADLQRFLEGRPVTARTRGAGSRAARWIAGHRLAAGTAAGVLLLLGGGGAAAWLLSARSDDTAGRLERETAQLSATERAGRVATAWLALQRDSLAHMQVLEDRAQGAAVSADAAAAALTALRGVVERVRAESPDVHAAQAWLALALVFAGDAEAAAPLFEAAVKAADPSIDPFPRLLRARLELSRYVALLQTPSLAFGAEAITLGDLGESPRMRASRELALADLQAIPASAWTALPSAAGDRAFAGGAATLAQREWDAALAALAPLRDDPALAAAAGMLGGFAAFASKRFVDAAARWEAAGKRGWPRALELAALAHLGESLQADARGDDPTPRLQRGMRQLETVIPSLTDPRHALLNLANTQLALGTYRRRHGQDGVPSLQAGVATLDRLIALDASWVTPWVHRAGARLFIALAEEQGGRDPTPVLEEAVNDYGRAIALTPEYGSAWSGRSTCWLQIARYAAKRGAAAGAYFQHAIDDAQAAVTRDPDRATFHSATGTALAGRARWHMSRGGDPSADLAGALAALGRAVELIPDSPSLRREFALALHQRAMWAERVGEDRVPWLDAEIEQYEHALAVNGRDAESLIGRAGALHERGRTRARLGGGDPEPDHVAAAAGYGAALGINPRSGRAFNNRGYVHADLARLAKARGADPRPWYAKALADYAAALDLQPTDKDAWVNRGSVLFERAEYAAEHGGDPVGDLLASEQALSEAIRFNPAEANAFLHRGGVHALRATLAVAAGADPRPHVRLATADFAEAIRLNPTDIRLRNARCLFHQDVATIAEALGDDPRPHLQAALADADAALARNPNYTIGLINRCNICNSIAELERRAGGDWRRWYRASNSAAQRTLAVNPDDWNGLLMRGYTADRLGLTDEAITYYGKALERREHAGIRRNYERLLKARGR